MNIKNLFCGGLHKQSTYLTYLYISLTDMQPEC